MAKFVAILVALVTAAAAQAPPGPQQNPPPAPQQAAPAAQQAPPSTSVPIKTNTRLITVDVVATDSHGNAVRGLKASDFQIFEEHTGQQKIVDFEFIDSASPAAPAASPVLTASPAAPYLFSNRLPDRMRVPPTILLMDALNTDIKNQSVVHQHMVALLKTLPPTTPIAVFVLGHELHVVQSFTTDPALLRAAVDHTLRSPDIEQNPQDDPNSVSNTFLDRNGDQETPANQALEDFEKTEFEAEMSIRVDETTDAMVSIAKFLGGYPGRKNLLWFSESFPFWIEPSTDFGTDSFRGSAIYTDKIRTASDALADARIAVYPVDARGLQVSQIYNADQTPHINWNNPGGSLAGTMNRDNNSRIDAQATMQKIAEDTGGKPCLNTNDLSGCVQAALDDSSAYYQLAYYPENIKWDGRFHRINVKTSQHGVKLRYRSGYLAVDPAAITKQPPEKLLQQICQDPLPSTGIAISAEALPPKQSASDSGASRYLLTISPNSLSFAPGGSSLQMSVRMAVCEYDPKGASFQFFPRDLSGAISEATYQNWKANGFRSVYDYDAKPDDRRLRFAVLDVPSGAAGSLDVPAHPQQFGSLPAQLASSPPPAAAVPLAPPPPAAPPLTHLGFRASNGASSMLDWSGETLTYEGELGVDQGAPALFKDIFGARFHCEAGSLAPIDATSGAQPNFTFTFRKPDGTRAVVDLGGSAPVYSGNLPVDASARVYFDYLWKLCHCQHP